MTIFTSRWTGEILGNIMLLCLCADHFNRAKDIMQKIIKAQNKIIGAPSSESVEMMIDACIEKKEAKLAVVCNLFTWLKQFCKFESDVLIL